jgi:hypothetical protein
VASARQALRNDSSLYTILVAYSAFGDCETELTNTGIPSPRAAPAVHLLRDACRLLVHASDLFERATQHDDPAALVAAGNSVLLVEPLLAQARLRLRELRAE